MKVNFLLRSVALLTLLLMAACASADLENSQLAGPTLEVQNQTIAFELEVGASDSTEFTLTSVGGEDVIFAIENDADWLEISPSEGTIAPEVTQDLSVTATCPMEVDEYSTTLLITSNDVNAPYNVDITLNCQVLPLGDLQLLVEGLPDELDADIAITGPDDFSADATSAQLFENLAVGTYTITAVAIGDDARFEPTPTETTIDVEAAAQAEATINYEVVPGSVQVTVEGLPVALSGQAELTLVRDDERWDFPASGLLEGLDPDLYTVQAADVVDGETTYKASEVDASVVSDGTTEITITYIIDPGALQVTVTGLPDATTHDIDLIDADGDTTPLPQSGEFSALEPGEYDLVANPVVVGLATYTAEAASVTITSDELVEISLTYSAVPGELDISVLGLDGLNADITLEGQGEIIAVTESTTLTGLAPGTYDITVADIEDLPSRYTGSAPATIDIASGHENDPLEITHDLITAELTVEITGLNGLDADVQVVGPEFTETVTGSDTFSGLTPGEYSVSVNNVVDGLTTYSATPSWTTQTIESGDQEALVITYSIVPAELTVQINGLDGINANVEVSGPNFDQTLTATDTFPDILPGDYIFTVNPVTDGPATFEGSDTTLSLASDDSETVIITYERVTGTLEITATDLPAGLLPDIRVVGDGFDESFDADTTLSELNPGDYSVECRDIIDQNEIYRADPTSLNITVARDSTTQAQSTYELVLGTINIVVEEFGDVDFEVALTGPDGATITAAETFNDMTPGSYTLSVNSISSDILGNPGSLTFDPEQFELASDDTTTVTITVAPGTLVYSEADSGPGSLRDVVAAVIDGSTVEFDASVEEISFTGAAIEIGDNLIIEGRPDASLILNNEASNRFFTVSSNASLGIYGLTMRNSNITTKGGAILVDTNASALVERAIFESNAATNGGAIQVEEEAQLYVTESIFTGNTATENGGAISTDSSVTGGEDIQIDSSLFTENFADNHGGAMHLAGIHEIRDSTFFNNEASTRGGAIRIYDGETTILGSTITQNTASIGGGVHFQADSLTDLILGRSIVAGNTATTESDIGRASTTTPVTSLGFNVVGVAQEGIDDGVNGDQAGTEAAPLDPLLDPLADNGGFTITMAPQQTSPANQAVPADVCEEMGELTLPLRDQRGVRRPAGAFCHAGALENNSLNETLTNADMSAGGYSDGSFEGDNGVTWTYQNVRRSTTEWFIEDTGIIFRKSGDSLSSDVISGGISSLSLQMSHAFTGSSDRQIEVLINGAIVGTSIIFNDAGVDPRPIYRFAVDNLATNGNFTIEIRNLGEQVVIDNITWQ